MAMAKGARQRGVTIERKWQADAYHWTGEAWEVTLTKMVEKGGNLVPSDEQIVITAEHVVTATGNHAQRTAQTAGHQDPGHSGRASVHRDGPGPGAGGIPQGGQPEHPVLRDADAQVVCARRARRLDPGRL